MAYKHVLGFSLLELMIVIAIIGILAMIAIPSYQRYSQRARFTEVIGISQIYKTAIAVALQQEIPKKDLKNGQFGIPENFKATANIASINVENAVITVLTTSKLGDVSYILTPNDDGSQFTISGTCLSMGLCNE